MENNNVKISYNGIELSITSLFKTDHIYKYLKTTGSFYELKLLEKVKSLNLKGTYVDVGANIGNHTVFFSKFCTSDKVISIEMDSSIYKILNKNINNLNILNTKLINVGVGEKFKKVKTSNIDKTNVGMTKIIGEDGDVIVNTLDNILSNEENITIIKFDIEGYEKNALLGSKEIIKKHSPIIIAELKDNDEFVEFEKIAKDFGYYTDKINYASTPTYFWYKKEEIYDYVYIIPTYERFDKVTRLIDDVFKTGDNILIILLNDGSTDDRYKSLVNYDKRLIYLKNEINNGKNGYWMTVNTLLNEMSKYKFRHGVMLGDDFQLANDYKEKLEKYIDNVNIIRLFTQFGVNETNWGLKNWVDGIFCAPYEFFNKLNFELFPIKRRSSMTSSGVGQQMSERLTKLGYVVKNYGSLVHHIGNEDSKMHPTIRKSQPLITNFVGDSNLEKIFSIIIPTFKNVNYLNECIHSILKSIDDLDCEILVGIDDCYETKKFVENNKFDNRISFYYFDKNVGPYVIKNTLSTLSKSGYLLFFDSDDIMNHNMIYNLLEYKKTHKIIKPMYFDFLNDVSNVNHKVTKTKTYGEGVFAIDKQTFLGMGGFKGWRCAADSEFFNRVYKKNIKLITTNTVCFYRRIHPNSLTQHPDTNYSSKKRREYSKLIQNEVDLEFIHIDNCKQLIVNYYEKSLIKKQFNYEKRLTSMDIVNRVLHKKPINPNREPSNNIDYDKINKTIVKEKEVIKPNLNRFEIQNKPKNREETLQLKKNSLSYQANKLKNVKPNRTNLTPNVFGGKKRV